MDPYSHRRTLSSAREARKGRISEHLGISRGPSRQVKSGSLAHRPSFGNLERTDHGQRYDLVKRRENSRRAMALRELSLLGSSRSF